MTNEAWIQENRLLSKLYTCLFWTCHRNWVHIYSTHVCHLWTCHNWKGWGQKQVCASFLFVAHPQAIHMYVCMSILSSEVAAKLLVLLKFTLFKFLCHIFINWHTLKLIFKDLQQPVLSPWNCKKIDANMWFNF